MRIDRHDVTDRWDFASQRRLDHEAERRELGRTVDAGTLEEQAHAAVLVDGGEFDVAAIEQQTGSEPIEDGFDLPPEPSHRLEILRHGRCIGRARAVVEGSVQRG